MSNGYRRDNRWTQDDYNRVLNSNIKLVDQAKQLRLDIDLIIRYFTNKRYLNPEEIRIAEAVIQSYSKVDEGKMRDASI
jgi:hypothetical protein